MVCVGGPEAVRLFYDPERFRRRDAIPRPLARTLFGRNAVHLHDGQGHRQRKAMLLGLLDPAAAGQIATVADRFAFVPHGGGDAVAGHRCPGERLTVELLKGAVRVLAGLRYDVPDQDLCYPLSRMPTRPRSGFIVSHVRQA